MCFYLGFATWTCDEKTAEWREMPNIDDCVSKDVRKKHPNHSSKCNTCKAHIYI